MTPKLVVTAGPDKGRFFNLTAGETLQVGRSQSTATRLTDPTMLRVHCQVEWDGRPRRPHQHQFGRHSGQR